MSSPTIAAKNPAENMVLGKKFLEKAGSLQEAQRTLTQVASSQTNQATTNSTCPNCPQANGVNNIATA